MKSRNISISGVKPSYRNANLVCKRAKKLSYKTGGKYRGILSLWYGI